MNAEQIEYQNHRVVTVRRQEMHCTVVSQCSIADDMQLLHRGGVCHSALCCHIAHAVNTAVPYDVVDVYVVADKCFGIVVDNNRLPGS